jgi:hypothetical protein
MLLQGRKIIGIRFSSGKIWNLGRGEFGEIVSKLRVRSKSRHDRGRHVFCFPHPNPLPEGEGAKLARFYDFLSL